MEKLLLTVWEAADGLSVSRSRVYELLYAEQPVWTGAGYCDPDTGVMLPTWRQALAISTPTRMPDRSTSCGSEPITKRLPLTDGLGGPAFTTRGRPSPSTQSQANADRRRTGDDHDHE